VGWDPALYVDLGTPAELRDGYLRTVDLDLDVVRHRDGRVARLDEDEFTADAARFGYPAEVVDTVVATAGWLEEAVTARRPPFGHVRRPPGGLGGCTCSQEEAGEVIVSTGAGPSRPSFGVAHMQSGADPADDATGAQPRHL
jgi:hypothetical protein